ncbi:hypothetical protein FKP32DRAFT_665400 [Trametes sanguinea]|nr:hypothetical protein FKP32DRAFT_665400 [Trametes sanguinea]
MDSGFDDLLAPSRDALANPFEDPFSKPRSSSPDPWASFGHTSPFNEEAAAFGSTSPTAAHHNAFADVGGFQDSFHETAPDPLDAPAFNAAEAKAEEEESSALSPAEEVTSPTTPGFRESISTEAEEPEHREGEKQLEQGPLREPSPPAEQPTKVPTPPVQPPIQPTQPSSDTATTNSAASVRLPGHTSRSSTASLASSHVAPLKAEPVAYNPLGQPTNTLERSIAGLSIGGEALGGWQDSGWQSSQPPFASAGPSASTTTGQSVSDDDDDDDRPIAQTIAARAARGREQASAPVSLDRINPIGYPV